MSTDQIAKLRKKLHDNRYDMSNRNLQNRIRGTRSDIRVQSAKKQ